MGNKIIRANSCVQSVIEKKINEPTFFNHIMQLNHVCASINEHFDILT